MELTYSQFKSAVEGVAKKINWEMQLSLASINPESIKSEYHPLYGKAEVEEQVFMLKDAQALQALANS